MRPRELDANSFTHIVYSFASVSRGDFRLTETQSDDKELITELQALKKINPNLKTMWAVGGWAFNVSYIVLIVSLTAGSGAIRTLQRKTYFL